MAPISKKAGPKHEATMPPMLADFVLGCQNTTLPELYAHLHTFPARWPFPRGDLYHWIPVLNRFDWILEHFIDKYKLHGAPQTIPFGLEVLRPQDDLEGENRPSSTDISTRWNVEHLGPDGDRQLIELILNFSCMLLENCGNRSLYNSSERLADLLSTTSLSLLACTLRLASRLASRYHHARMRNGLSAHLSSNLLSSHYNIRPEHIQRMTETFVRLAPQPGSVARGSSIVSDSSRDENTGLSSSSYNKDGQSSSSKGKGNVEAQGQRQLALHAYDLYDLAVSKHEDHHEQAIRNATALIFEYYDSPSSPSQDAKDSNPLAEAAAPSGTPPTPTPTRRTSGGIARSRIAQGSEATTSSGAAAVSTSARSQTSTSGSTPAKSQSAGASTGELQTLVISRHDLLSQPLEILLETHYPRIPRASQFDFLHQLRTARAAWGSRNERRQMLAVRILALTNLAYIWPDPVFQQKILRQDSDEPRHRQIVEQLRKLIHDPEHAHEDIPLSLRTIALGALEALMKQPTRASDVLNALGITVSHGALLHILRQAVSDLAREDPPTTGSTSLTSDQSILDQSAAIEADEWRDALFSLLDSLPALSSRTIESLVAAGLFDILVDALKLRTSKAERVLHKVLIFVNSITHGIRDAHQTFATHGGLDAIADLVNWEVTSSMDRVRSGQGLSDAYRSQVMDYKMPFFQQQTLRWLFKFINQMMQFNNVNVDRLLRNLIDSPPLLTGLREVIAHADIFGSSIWSGAITIMSCFIHNEPTSYAVVAEAGLTRALLESVARRPVDLASATDSIDDTQWIFSVCKTNQPGRIVVHRRPNLRAEPDQSEDIDLLAPRPDGGKLAQGILPASDTIINVPQAFGAICLNNAGLNLFLESGALDAFFQIFESPSHVKSMRAQADVARALGGTFDELVRHHPRLKPHVLRAIILMVARVVTFCQQQKPASKTSAAPQSQNSLSNTPSASQSALPVSATSSSPAPATGEDTDMVDTDGPVSAPAKSAAEQNAPTEADYVGVVAKFLVGFCENQTLCVSFLQGGGLDFLLDLATLPNLPPEFDQSTESQELSRAIHMLAEYRAHLVIPSLIARTSEAMDTMEPLLAHDAATPFLDCILADGKSDIQHDESSGDSSNNSAIDKAPALDADTLLINLTRIHTLCTILHEAFSHMTYSSRSSSSLFNQINLADRYVDLIGKLGRLFRVCVWEEIMLQKRLPDAAKSPTAVLTPVAAKESSVAQASQDSEPGAGDPSATRTGDAMMTGSQAHDATNASATESRPPNPPNGLGVSNVVGTDDSGTSNDAVTVSSNAVQASAVDGDPAQPALSVETMPKLKPLRFLLSQIPSAITSCFVGLGRNLLFKRKSDLYQFQRQSSYAVADSLAQTLLDHLRFQTAKDWQVDQDKFAYWIVVLTAVAHLIVEGPLERSNPQCMTIVLQSFKKNGGLDILNQMLRTFHSVAQDKAGHELGFFTCALGGMKIILFMYSQITQAKIITESPSTQGIATSDRDRESPFFFSTAQFIVELRSTVLDAVRPIWDNPLPDPSAASIVKCVVDILRTIFDADSEHGAFKRGDAIPIRHKVEWKPFNIAQDRLETLTREDRFPREAAQEALYRTWNGREAAEQYCEAQRFQIGQPSLPVPERDLAASSNAAETSSGPSGSGPSAPQTGAAAAADTMSQTSGTESAADDTEPSIEEPDDSHGDAESHADEVASNAAEIPAMGAAEATPAPADADGQGMAMSIDNLLSLTEHVLQPPNGLPAENASPTSPAAPSGPASGEPLATVTVTDLKEARNGIRKDLIDHVLDTLSAHEDLTFELADLIMAAASKAADPALVRKEISQTLVQSLTSFQLDDDFRPLGAKIASYANLLAILIQQKDFYEAAVTEMADNFDSLLRFVQIFPDQNVEERSPWVGQILLVLEKLLAEDEQPQQVRWTPPGLDWSSQEDPHAEMVHVVSIDNKMNLLNRLTDLLPRIGKNQSLALSVVRILAILTRTRQIADVLGEKRNFQRLFLMVKQLAGVSDEKFHKAFMLILRHIIEDDDTIRAIMRAEIVGYFQPNRTRSTDTQAYVRQMGHLVLRSPSIFLEITNEKLRLQNFDHNSRPQALSLKADPESAQEDAANPSAQPSEISPTAESSSSNPATKSNDPNSAATESPTKDDPMEDRTKQPDVKAPILEKPDGVIHYLLSQLLSYRDVEDSTSGPSKDQTPKGSSADTSNATAEGSSSSAAGLSQPNNGDQTTSPASAPAADGPAAESRDKKPEKEEYHADQHPIYNYQCFLLQTLTELLMSYSSAKAEFINFSRKADPKVMSTPSKPRSGVLNYLLNSLIPLGVLDRPDSIAFKKKYGLSSWAISVIVGLCLKPNMSSPATREEDIDETPDPELLFVRKFVLENVLKSFKDAQVSTEALEVKYARMLSLSDLFYRLLMGRVFPNIPTYVSDQASNTHREIARVMFEKGFIAALTNSVADIDLNFPGAKRLVKYVLRPLRVLTDAGIYLSQNTDLTLSLGQGDDDEISAASSLSDFGEDREETPDLFRHSTLGMLDPDHEEDLSSEGSDEDEEMYDEDEYDDGLDYEEEIEHDQDEVVSDEEEQLGDAGPVEGLPGDMGMDVEVVIDEEDGSMDDDDDEDEDDDDDDDDEDDEDDESVSMESDDMEDGEEVEIVGGEVMGSDGDSMPHDDAEAWEDEEDDDVDADDAGHSDHEAFVPAGMDPDVEDERARIADEVESVVRNLTGAAANSINGGIPDLEMDVEHDRFVVDTGLAHGDLEVDGGGVDLDEDDEDDVLEENMAFDPEFDDGDGNGMELPPWGWGLEGDGDDVVRVHRHHHHTGHGRRIPSPWTMFPPGADRGMIVPSYRSHRVATGGRAADEGINPLLMRLEPQSIPRRGHGNASQGHHAPLTDWVHMIHPRHRGEDSGAVSFINHMMSAIGLFDAPPGTLHFHMEDGNRVLPFPRELHQLLTGRSPGDTVHPPRMDASLVPLFYPTRTNRRWQEEGLLLFGANSLEKTQRITNSLLSLLVPPAIEEEKARKLKKLEEEQERRKQQEAAQAAKEEQEAKEKAEKEALEKEKRDREEQAAQASAAAAAATNQPVAADDGDQTMASQASQASETSERDAMEGVEATDVAVTPAADPMAITPTSSAPAMASTLAPAPAPAAEAGPSTAVERVRAVIRGREVDITGMGIDLEYLNELPEEFREEVLMQQVAEQRSQATAAGEPPSEITREFLEALPADIREEIMQQEAQDRRRREREEARRQNAASGEGGPARAEDMDPASFLASLDPVLRNAVLLDQDDEMLAQLPASIAAEARALGSDRMPARWSADMPRLHRSHAQRLTRGLPLNQSTDKKPRRQVVQMVDKSGVATLLRLLFIQQSSSQDFYYKILENIAQNRQCRTEVINLLLNILQEGSADVGAIERSFHQLTSRAKQLSGSSAPRTPQLGSAKRNASISGASHSPFNSEMTPLMVIQHCLTLLVHLTTRNIHVPSFFLVEHEPSTMLKSKAAKKGKGKDNNNKSNRFALNALLTLLDRKMIMDSAGCMEQLVMLLRSITLPLTMLRRKEKEKPAEAESSKPQIDPVASRPSQETSPEPGLPAPITTDQEAPQAAPPPPAAPVDTQPSDAAPTNSEAIVEPDKEGEDVQDDKVAKKARLIVPPVIPERNIRLVVNILTARECSSKTFRDAVTTIDNLSSIPKTKVIFGQELIQRAQQLADSISRDLDLLLPQLEEADASSEAQAAALAKFQPSSSDQAKLLRVLTALDYLFDPERTAKLNAKDDEPDEQAAKETMLSALYESSTFGPLWSKLSDCLNAVRQRDQTSTLNVATILLPLVEALMVVCKNTTLKDHSIVRESKNFAVQSPAPEPLMESLFFRFTEDHRKILNNLVRHNPRLMSGTFALLVKNPKVLEFDNKRNYFTRRLHTRADARPPQPPLQFAVRRDLAFMDSYANLSHKSPDEIKYGKLSVRFRGEEGVDAGGVTREWFQVMSRQMFNPLYALFVSVASDSTTFHPNKLSQVNPEHLAFFKFIGQIIGKALYEGRALDCHFSRAVYKRILGKTVSIKDMETLDLDYYKSLLWMLENDISDIITETFSVEVPSFGVTEIVDLIENGRNIPVTEENKHEFVQLVVEYRLTGSVKDQLEQFLKGFHDIVPAGLISIFNEQELELLISGLPDIDVDDWKANTEYHNYSASSAQIQWFWRAVRSFDKEERAKLLQFVTGTSKVPLNGFRELEGMNGCSRFNIHRDYGSKDRLPSSHTCFNQLDLPEYESYEILRHQLYVAMTAGSDYFGFA